MRKAILILIAVLAFYAQAHAMGNRSYNARVFGSDDHQRNHDTPVHQVPEPNSIILLGIGALGIYVYRKLNGE